MGYNSIFFFMMALGLIKATLFALFVRWCLKNDCNSNPGGGGNGGGNASGPDSPYSPSWGRMLWRKQSRRPANLSAAAKAP